MEPLRHRVNVGHEPETRFAQAKPVRRQAVQKVEDANESMRRGGLPSVDLAADEVERPLEPGDLQERVVVGGIDVAALKLPANDLLHPADAEPFGGGDGANRLPADEAGENAPGVVMRLGGGTDGLGGWSGHGLPFC
jgi:hypothetical protein